MDLSSTDIDLSPKAERAVAREFMGRIEWQAIVIGLGQFAVWSTVYVLAMADAISLWVAFPIALVCTLMAYLPSHEGQHGNLSGRRPNLKWIDSFVGQLSVIPLASSHVQMKASHMKHHAHTNDPELDPDHSVVTAEGRVGALLAIHRRDTRAVQRHLQEDPKFRAEIMRGMPVAKGLKLAQLVLAVLFPLPTLLLWWLPNKIALSYLGLFFAREPHLENATGRYADTRFWKYPVPRYLLQSMPTHLVHHAYPSIPHWDEPKALEALRPYFIERGVPGAQDIPERVRFHQLIGRSPVGSRRSR